MVYKQTLLETFAAENAPITEGQLSKRLNMPSGNFHNQVKRMVSQGLLSMNGSKEYEITDAGRREASNPDGGGDQENPTDPENQGDSETQDGSQEETEGQGDGSESEDQGSAGDGNTGDAKATAKKPQYKLRPPPSPSEETQKVTEYQMFVDFGLKVGITPDRFVKMVADHVFAGGDFDDLKWVWEALTEMAIRADLAKRWLARWRSYRHQAMPPDLAQKLYMAGDGTTSPKPAIPRDYVLDGDNSPQKVGEGSGTMTYDDAISLSKLRAIQRTPAANAAAAGMTVGSYGDELAKVLKAIKEISGNSNGDGKAKSYVVKANPETGQMEVTEQEEGKPILVGQPPGPTPGTTYMIDEKGEVQALEPGKPTVIFRAAPAAPPPSAGATKTLVVDKATGIITEVLPGQPIVINQAPANNPAAGGDPLSQAIQMVDENGKPVVFNLGTYMKLEDFRDKRRQAQEMHEVKVDMFKEFKKGISTIAKAAQNVAGEEG